jgi:hypothetical protein
MVSLRPLPSDLSCKATDNDTLVVNDPECVSALLQKRPPTAAPVRL